MPNTGRTVPALLDAAANVLDDRHLRLAEVGDKVDRPPLPSISGTARLPSAIVATS